MVGRCIAYWNSPLLGDMLVFGGVHIYRSLTLPETNTFAPENGWLEYDPFLLGETAYFQVQTCER